MSSRHPLVDAWRRDASRDDDYPVHPPVKKRKLNNHVGGEHYAIVRFENGHAIDTMSISPMMIARLGATRWFSARVDTVSINYEAVKHEAMGHRRGETRCCMSKTMFCSFIGILGAIFAILCLGMCIYTTSTMHTNLR